MQDWLTARTGATPGQVALRFAGEHYTYAGLHATAGDYAAALRSVNVGDRVGVYLPAGYAYVAVIFALMRRGAVMVPLNTRLTADELRWQLQNARCTALISDDSLPDGIADGFTRYHVNQLHAQNPHPPRPVDLDAPLMIVYTSGTSGKPKGALLTYGNVFYSAMASAYRLGHLPDDVWLCTLPLFHVGGLSIVLRACLYGITVDLRSRFDANAVNHALTHEAISLVSLVPTMLYRLLDQRSEPWSDKLRLVLLGGAAASPELMQRCIDEGVPVATTYGLSEAASQVVTALPSTAMSKPGTVGKPLMFTQVRMVDEQGNDTPPGDYGEIIVKGLTTMRGYVDNPQATAQTLRDGWLHTGDIGYFDANGDLWLVQRRSDLIVTGGENVYPAEVEAVLRQHPAVEAVAVVGVDHPEWGQQVAAAVVLHTNITLEALQTFSRKRLAGYKQPRRFIFIEQLPQTDSGKIARQAVRALFHEA